MNRMFSGVFRRVIPMICLLVLQACNFSIGQIIPPAETSAAVETAVKGGTLAHGKTGLPGETAAVPSETPTTIAPTDTATPIPVPLVYPVGPTGFPADVNPLTGLRVSDPKILDRRPLGIKVTNYPRSARPQAGLSKADLLFEFYTEYGNTRLIAVYYGQEAEKVGPIRSARIMDTRIVPHYDMILVHVQAYETVWQVISQTGISTINEFPASCPAICRDPSVEEAVNSVFANTVELTKYARMVGMLAGGRPSLEGMLFDPTPPAGAKSSIGTWVRFSSSAYIRWQYDSASNRYLRFSEKDTTGALEPLKDRTTGQQLAVDNVVLMIAPILPFYKDKLPSEGELWDLDLSTSGKAYFFRDGMIVEGQWQNAGPASPLKFVTKDGQIFALHPGSTYIGILGINSIGGAVSSTEWQFTNGL